jgi:hypothetical protein
LPVKATTGFPGSRNGREGFWLMALRSCDGGAVSGPSGAGPGDSFVDRRAFRFARSETRPWLFRSCFRHPRTVAVAEGVFNLADALEYKPSVRIRRAESLGDAPQQRP